MEHTIIPINTRKTEITVQYLFQAGFRVDEESKDSIGLRPVYVATQTQRSDILEVLLAAGADPNLATGDNRVPLLTACQTGNVTCTRMLLKAGADPNTPTPRLKGTPLHLVAQSGHENARKLCQLLVDAGCDVTRRNFFGKTALHSACGSRRDVTKIIDFLLLHGEDINGRDERGQTPLMHAASLDNVRTVQYLIQQNADKTCRDSEGRSALDVAMEKKFKEVVLSLADHKS